MCDCRPKTLRYSFRCKRKGGISIFGWDPHYSLEFTILHFWLYMVFLGILIAFILSSLGCYFQRFTKKFNSRCGGVSQSLPAQMFIPKQKQCENVSRLNSSFSISKPCVSSSSISFDSKIVKAAY